MKSFSVFLISLFFAASGFGSLLPGEYIVKFKSGVSAERIASKKLIRGGHGRFLHQKRKVLKLHATSAAEAEALRSDPDLEFIEPNYTVNLDPVSSDEIMGMSVASTQVSEAWPLLTPLSSAPTSVVAVIDSGLDSNHPVLTGSNSVWINVPERSGKTGVDDDGNGFVDDISGWNFITETNANTDDNNHGTHVAGIVLSAGQDILSDLIFESKIKIMALKFLSSSGMGATSDAIQAIYYAVDNGANVINNSWGSSNFSKALQDAYEYANSKGVVIVSAAGNYASNNDEVSMYPANYRSANNIVVMATTKDDAKASFSNFGASSVSVAAPGVSIISTVPGSCEGGCFKAMSGTSMAVPFVAGLAALVKRETPHSSAAKIKSIILGTADKIPALDGTSVTGGRVNVLKSIVMAQSTAPDDSSEVNVLSPPNLQNSNGGGAGCALIAASKFRKNPEQSTSHLQSVMILLLLPLMLAFSLRRKMRVLL